MLYKPIQGFLFFGGRSEIGNNVKFIVWNQYNLYMVQVNFLPGLNALWVGLVKIVSINGDQKGEDKVRQLPL